MTATISNTFFVWSMMAMKHVYVWRCIYSNAHRYGMLQLEGEGACMSVCTQRERERQNNLANQASQSQDENELKLSNFRQKMN